MAHPAAAPDGQRPRLFERAHRAGRRRGSSCSPTSKPSRWASLATCRSPPAAAASPGTPMSCRWGSPAASSSRSNRPASTWCRWASPGCSRCSPTAASTRSSATNIIGRCTTSSRTSATSSSSITRSTRRGDSDFWNYCRTMDVPDSLAAKIELWRAKGRIFREGRELFGTPSWVAVLLGQGMVPEEAEPAADAIDPAFVTEALDKMRASYRQMAEHMPTHAEFIAQACAAAAASRVCELAQARARSAACRPSRRSARCRVSGGRRPCGSRWSPATRGSS